MDPFHVGTQPAWRRLPLCVSAFPLAKYIPTCLGPFFFFLISVCGGEMVARIYSLGNFMNALPMLTAKQGERAECRVIGLGKAVGPDAAPSPLRAAVFSGPVPVPSADGGGKWLRCPKKLFAASTFFLPVLLLGYKSKCKSLK